MRTPGNHKPYRPKPRDGGLMPYQRRQLEKAIDRVSHEAAFQRKYGKPYDYGQPWP